MLWRANWARAYAVQPQRFTSVIGLHTYLNPKWEPSCSSQPLLSHFLISQRATTRRSSRSHLEAPILSPCTWLCSYWSEQSQYEANRLNWCNLEGMHIINVQATWGKAKDVAFILDIVLRLCGFGTSTLVIYHNHSKTKITEKEWFKRIYIFKYQFTVNAGVDECLVDKWRWPLVQITLHLVTRNTAWSVIGQPNSLDANF